MSGPYIGRVDAGEAAQSLRALRRVIRLADDGWLRDADDATGQAIRPDAPIDEVAIDKAVELLEALARGVVVITPAGGAR